MRMPLWLRALLIAARLWRGNNGTRFLTRDPDANALISRLISAAVQFVGGATAGRPIVWRLLYIAEAVRSGSKWRSFSMSGQNLRNISVSTVVHAFSF